MFAIAALVSGFSAPAFAQSTLYGLAYSGDNGPASLYSIDKTTGTATLIGPTGFERCSGMDADASGTLYATCERTDGSNEQVLVIIDPSSGAGVEVGPIGIASSSEDVMCDISFRNSDGVLYAYQCRNIPVHNIYTIDKNSGAGTFVGNSGFSFTTGNGLTFSLGDVLYHARGTAPGWTLNTVNQITGLSSVLTVLSDTPLIGERLNAMDADPDTGIIYAVANLSGGGSDTLATVDPATGTVTLIGLSTSGLDAIAFIPESAVIGGTIISIDSTALMVAGLQGSAFWLIPVVISAAGIGLVLVKRK